MHPLILEVILCPLLKTTVNPGSGPINSLLTAGSGGHGHGATLGMVGPYRIHRPTLVCRLLEFQLKVSVDKGQDDVGVVGFWKDHGQGWEGNKKQG